MLAVNELRAKLNWQIQGLVMDCVNAPANPVASLQDCYRQARAREIARGSESGCTGAHYQN
jgi:hypothetical protein